MHDGSQIRVGGLEIRDLWKIWKRTKRIWVFCRNLGEI